MNSELIERLRKLIPLLEEGRETHVAWRDYFKAHPGKEKNHPDVGGYQFHADMVSEYDERISVFIEAADALSAQDSAQDEIDDIAEARGPVEAMAAENMRAHLDSAQTVPFDEAGWIDRFNIWATDHDVTIDDHGMIGLLELVKYKLRAPASAPVKECVWRYDREAGLAQTSCEHTIRAYPDDPPKYCRECAAPVRWENGDV